MTAPNLSKPRVLENTFLALMSDCIFLQLDTCDLEHGIADESQPNTLLPSDILQIFLWAYDVIREVLREPDAGSILFHPVLRKHQDVEGFLQIFSPANQRY
ncbi:hypothetical protein QQZ08_003638 [Neonectria magnoliae]|uniref:Uncharacterized protein n=1 Tax=Neonectria magnoliae TaxID=2732573 RepID=A0ABR1I871_9HYPO